MTDTLIANLLTTWPDRWRYPDLAIDIMRTDGEMEPARAARLMLLGMARPRSPLDSVNDLVAAGRFADAEDLLLGQIERESDSAPPNPTAQEPAGTALTSQEWSRAEATISSARERAAGETSRQWVELRARADGVGVGVGVGGELPDEPYVVDLARRSLPDARRLLAAATDRVVKAEDTRSADLMARLRAVTAMAPAGDHWIESWAQSVAACVLTGEFEVADNLITAGPDDTPDAGPLTVPPPPLDWPWGDLEVTDVLRWYRQPDSDPRAEFARFRLSPGDTEAARLVAVLARFADGVNAALVRDLAIALTAVLGESASPRVTGADGRPGFLSTVFGLRDARLPHLTPLGTKGVTLWVNADGSTAEPPNTGGPIIWFQPVLTVTDTPRPDVAVLGVSDLLRVLAADPKLRPTNPTMRRINLARILISRLNPDVVLGATEVVLGDGASQRDSLAWLFDLFGLLPDGPVLDSLLYDSGGHARALRVLLVELLRRPHAGPSRRVSLADAACTRLTEVRKSTRTALLAPLAGNTSARLVFLLALWQFNDTDVIIGERITAGLELLDAQPELVRRVRGHLSLERDLATLTEHGLLREIGTGQVALPSPGLCALLRDHADLRADAAEAFAALAVTTQQTDWAAAATLGGRVAQFISHRVDNDVIGITGLLSRAAEESSDDSRSMLDKAGDLVRAMGGGFFLSAYETALKPAEPVEVLGLVKAVIGEVEWLVLAAGQRIRCIGTTDAWVLANPFILREAVGGLIHNASRELAKPNRTASPGAIAVDVRMHEQLPLPEGVRVALPAAVIDVADNGAGFTSAELDRYRALAAADHTSPHPLPTRSGSGTGISQIIAWLRDYGGCLQLQRSERFGGACVSMWLPQIPAPTDGGTP